MSSPIDNLQKIMGAASTPKLKNIPKQKSKEAINKD